MQQPPCLRRPGTFALTVLALTTGAPPGFAQGGSGAVAGTVTDASGRSVSDAIVTAARSGVGFVRSARTDQDGAYTLLLLPPDRYDVTVERAGFRTLRREGLVVHVEETNRLDAVLQIGDRAETITIIESAVSPVSSADLGHVIEQEQILALPLNGRVFEQLVALAPGAVARGFSDFAENPAAAGARSEIHHTVNGIVWSGNSYLIDGIVDGEPLNAYINVTPPLESIKEFRIQTGGPSAEFGVFGGAVVSLVTRSGSRALEGTLFGYLRDDSLNSRSYFARERAPFASLQFGGSLGGPLVKERAYFLLDYQGLRQDQGRTQTLTVPTPLMRRGVLTEVGVPIYDPLTGLPFPGNVIPPERMDPVSWRAATDGIWPLPNRSGLVDNYVENNTVEQRLNAFDVRLDAKVGEQGWCFTRYSRAWRRYDEPAPGTVFMGANNAHSANDHAVAGYSQGIGGSRFYELRLGYSRFDLRQVAEDFGIDKNNELGIPNGNIPGLPYTSGIATFDISGLSPTGSPGFTNSDRIGTTYQLQSSLSWLTGRHSLKWGVDLRLVRATLTNPEVQPRGLLRFNRLYTSDQGREGTGDAWASFLVGYPTEVVRDFVDTAPRVRRTFLGLFVQDGLRLARTLTLNLGLRWDLMTPPSERLNRQANFSLEDGRVHLASSSDRAPAVDTRHDYWGPRIGVAYTMDGGRTVLRGGFGVSVFADNFGANGGTLERNYPFFQIVQLSAPDQLVPFRRVSDGLPGFTPAPAAAILEVPPGIAVFHMPRDFHEDVARTLNVGIQRQIADGLVAEANYVGTRGTHLFRARNVNVPFPGAGPLDGRRPFSTLAPGSPVIEERDGDGRSWYDAIQVSLKSRVGNRLRLWASYTVSRSRDTLFFIHPALEEAPRLSSTFKTVDVPHQLVVAWTYQLPSPSAEAGGQTLWRTLARGWSISAITSYQGGEPLAVLVAAPLLNTGTDNFADTTCPKAAATLGRTEQWFDTSCFAEPAPFAFGSSDVGDVRGPAVFNTDVSLSKRTALGKSSLELRIDVFNIFNRPHFANPNTRLGDAGFGRISATRLPPREVQLGVRVAF